MRQREVKHEFVEAVPDDPAEGTVYIGRAISLRPAVDNWKLACRSLYRIKRNRVRWLLNWSIVDAEVGRL